MPATKPFARTADIRVAVVGYGPSFNMGRHHLAAMRHAGMSPVAVADIDPTRLTAAAEEFPGIETYPSATDMLRQADVDLVGIITPHNTHADLALECLNAGKHVVTEKPFALTTDECDRMIAAADANDVMLSTYHNRHWDGCALEAIKRVESGLIGDIVRVEAHSGSYGKPRDWWRSSKSISGGVAYDRGAHFLEYALQLVPGSEIAEVTGFAKTGFWGPRTAWGEDGTEDEFFAVVRFRDGKWLTLCITRIDSNPKKGWLEVTGTRGSYIFDHQGWEAVVQEADGALCRRNGPSPASEGWRFYQNIADHLMRGEALVITPQWARRPIQILDLAGRSAEQGRALPAIYP